MGTDLFKHYSFDKNSFLSLGNNDVWNIHKGVHKDRKIPVCLFAVDKKQLKKITKDKKGLIAVLKKEAVNLAKIKHPNFLGIAEPVAEDKNSLGFISERFSYSLMTWFDQTSPTKLEIKSFVIDLCKAMIFLHEDAHIIHNNLNLNSILIDEMNRIKIASMGYSCNDPPVSGIEFKPDSQMMNFSYVAPEVVFDNKAYYASDVYSIGAILYSLLRKVHKASDYQLISSHNTTIEDYKSHFPTSYLKITNSNFEQEDIDLLNKCLMKDPTSRPSLKELIDNTWFNDPKLKALHFIEHLDQNETAKNNEFLQKLPKILHMFDNKIIIKRFLPSLLLAIKSEIFLASCLPSIFAISEKSELKINFEKDIWPSLKGVLSMKSIPASSLYFLLTKVKFICENISSKEFSSTFLNVICKAMDCNVAKIQSVVSDNLLIISKKIDSLSFKNQIYPRMINIMINTNSHSLKVQLLTSLKVLYSLLDQTIINENLLSSLEKIKKGDNTPDVCMKIASIYEEIAKIVSVESIANKILPNLIGIIVSGNISKRNFDALMQMIQKYLERIKKEREKDLTDDDSSTVDSNSGTAGGIEESEGGQGMGDKDDFLANFFGSSMVIASASRPIASKSEAFDKDIAFDLGKIDEVNNKKNDFVFDTTKEPSPIKATKSFDVNLNKNIPVRAITPTNIPAAVKGFNPSSTSSSEIYLNNNYNANTNQILAPNYNEDFTKHSSTRTTPMNMNPNISNKNKLDLDVLLNDLPSSQPNTNQNKPQSYCLNNPNEFNQDNLDFLKPKDKSASPYSINPYGMNTFNNNPSSQFNFAQNQPITFNNAFNPNNQPQFPPFSSSFPQHQQPKPPSTQHDLFDFSK